MTGWFKRQTSMRGRLSILLILLMVVPMVTAGWFGFRFVTGGDANTTRTGLPDDVRLRTALRVSETVEGLAHGLDDSLLEICVRLGRVRATDALSIQRAFADLPPALRPTTVAAMDSHGMTAPPLDAALVDALVPFVREGVPRRGYLVLPASTGGPADSPERLCQVVIEPQEGNRAYIALRPLSDAVNAQVLDHVPLGNTVAFALTLNAGPIQAQAKGRFCSVGSKATDLLAEHRGVPGEFWRSAAGLTGQHPVHQFRGSGTVLGGLALRDLAGEPVGLALVQSTDHDLFPQIGPGGQELESASAIIGWLAVVGVLLAIGMGMIAPRWVWHDIRASTDFIFNSVERLRELVRRNSRALDEQSEVIKSLMDSMNELDKASSSIAETSRILAHSAKQSAWVSQSGNQNAETAQRGVLEVRDRVVALSDQTEELERRCAAIGSILGLIDNLSNQTNDLSINATIQAAGAGMAGKQFATVASEIGKLAEQARKSTRDVQTVIEQIQESSRTTLDATRDGSREVERCLESFEELESAFARILRWVEQTTQSAHGIEQSTAVQAESLQAVSQSIESLEYRARETVGNYQAVVEAADELAMLGAEMNETWRVG